MISGKRIEEIYSGNDRVITGILHAIERAPGDAAAYDDGV